MLRDKLIGLDRYLRSDVPPHREPHDPADWLTLRNADGEPAIVELNGRAALLCFTSATWTDTELHDAIDAIQLAGWPSITGVRGCPAAVVEQAHRQGMLVILDAPLRCIMHVTDIMLESQP